MNEISAIRFQSPQTYSDNTVEKFENFDRIQHYLKVVWGGGGGV